MRVSNVCMFCQREHAREVDVTPEQLQAWMSGELIQRAMPHLSNRDREFLMTGAHDSCWEISATETAE